MRHIYISTACHHGAHDDCLPCEYCTAPCYCTCHVTERTPR